MSATAHSHSHGHSHQGTSQNLGVMAEKLLELKNSDPELFNQAWKKIPQSTQENILAYLRKHGGEAQVSTSIHGSFEDKNAQGHKHKGVAGHPSEPEKLDLELDTKHTTSLSGSTEPRKALQIPERPLCEWTDGELLARTLLDSETLSPGTKKSEPSIASELRNISKQNMVQIVQNELIRRLLQTIAG